MRANNMDYEFETRPNFTGDFQHDLRDWQIRHRAATLSIILGEVAEIYIRATVILGIKDDPIADCLRADIHFVLDSFWVMHDHMAALWRRDRYALLCRDFEVAANAGFTIFTYA